MFVLRRTSWVPYAGLSIVTAGVWGAFSSEPTKLYGYPNEMIYIVWAITMIIPGYFAMRRSRWDRRRVATIWGLVVGLTGAGGQLLLFVALAHGPAYVIFPITALSPAVTVLMAVGLLHERMRPAAVVGIVMALVSVVLFSVTSGNGFSVGLWLPLTIILTVAWGVQSYAMRKASLAGVNDGTTFGWMTISALVLIPISVAMIGGLPTHFPWQAPGMTAGTQLLNAFSALFLVMALSRGRAAVAAPTINALSPLLVVILSLIAYQTVPSVFADIGIVLALVGSTLIIRSEEKRSEEHGSAAVDSGPAVRQPSTTGAADPPRSPRPRRPVANP